MKPFVFEGNRRAGALLSTDTAGHEGGPTYRFGLWRTWDDGRVSVQVGRRSKLLLWVMLNPSTADHSRGDPTLKRVMGFSERWGYDGCVVVNLFSLRSPHPKDLKLARDPIGSPTDRVIAVGLRWTVATVAAWGVCGFDSRRHHVQRLLLAMNRPILCLGTAKDGSPKHPMARGRERVPDDQQPITWREAPRR